MINLFLGIIFVTEPLKINFKVYTLYYERTDLWQEMFVTRLLLPTSWNFKFGLQHFMKLSDSQSIRQWNKCCIFSMVYLFCCWGKVNNFCLLCRGVSVMRTVRVWHHHRSVTLALLVPPLHSLPGLLHPPWGQLQTSIPPPLQRKNIKGLVTQYCHSHLHVLFVIGICHAKRWA